MRGSRCRPWRTAGCFVCTSTLTKGLGVDELPGTGPIMKAERHTAATDTQIRVDDERFKHVAPSFKARELRQLPCSPYVIAVGLNAVHCDFEAPRSSI